MKRALMFASFFLMTACSAPAGDVSESTSAVLSESLLSSEELKKEKSDLYFEGVNGSYEVIATEQLQGKYADNTQILAVTLRYLNTTTEPHTPWFAVAYDLAAEQETETTIDLLMGANGQFPDDYKPEAVRLGETEIKPGAMADVVVGFVINSPGQPVHLRDMNLFEANGSIFERTIETVAP